MLEKAQRYLVAGLLDPFRRPGETVAGYQVLGGQADIPELSAAMGVKNTMLAIGDNWDRSRVYEEIAGACPDVRFPICIHPAAHIGSNVTTVKVLWSCRVLLLTAVAGSAAFVSSTVRQLSNMNVI